MTLNKALKQKNRLVGELNRQKEILQRENSQATPTSSTVDRAATLQRILDTTQELTLLKARIAIANAPIYFKIEQMSQYKALIAYLQGLNTTHGVVKTPQHYGGQIIETHYNAFLTREKVDEMVRNAQTQIENLQDEVDEYNAVTKLPEVQNSQS
jgi:hypothetical protein